VRSPLPIFFKLTRLHQMRIESIQVSLAKTVDYQGRKVSTGIFKEPVQGSVKVGKLNIEGDQQADLSVHGGEYKAIYSYALEHYDQYWRKQPGFEKLPNGMFGENLTTSGLKESEINIGDKIRFGNVLLEATEPRLPCSKLGVKFSDMHILKQFMQSDRFGIYYRVLEEGEFQPGSPIKFESRHPSSVKVYELIYAHQKKGDYQETLRRLCTLDGLDPSWQDWVQKQIGTLPGGKKAGFCGD